MVDKKAKKQAVAEHKAKREAVAEHKAARAELARVSAGTRTETDEYLAANSRVIETEKNVPWWRR